MTAWTTATEVKQYLLLAWDSLNYETGKPFADEAAFDTFLATLIARAQGRINAYCKRDFDADYATIPDDIKDICARVVCNMVQLMVTRKMGSLIRGGEWKITLPDHGVLTSDIKEDLADWVKTTDPQFYEQPVD